MLQAVIFSIARNSHPDFCSSKAYFQMLFYDVYEYIQKIVLFQTYHYTLRKLSENNLHSNYVLQVPTLLGIRKGKKHRENVLIRRFVMKVISQIKCNSHHCLF